MNILCLTHTPEAFQALQTYPINLIAVESISALVDTLTRIRCSGIILDVRCLIRTRDQKCTLHEFIDAFPTLRVNSTKDGSGFIPLGDPDAFINQACAAFCPRQVRRNRRVHLALPVLLARKNDPKMRSASKTSSIDLSENGMFLFSCEDWDTRESVWMRIMTIEDTAPIRGMVRWIHPWGTGLRYPGIGVTFEEISSRQYEELRNDYLLRQDNSQQLFVSEIARLETFIKQGCPDNTATCSDNTPEPSPVKGK